MEWIWKELFRPLLPKGCSIEDGLVAMGILCSYRFELSPSFSKECGLGKLSALTQMGGADIVASIWPYPDTEGEKPGFWQNLYYKRLGLGPHAVPRSQYDWPRHEQMLARLGADPRVTKVEEE